MRTQTCEATDRFIGAILGTVAGDLPGKLIIVTHVCPGSAEFLLSLDRRIPIAGLIPKPRSVDRTVLDAVRGQIPVLDFDRQKISSQTGRLLASMRSAIGSGSFAIIDTGGYFAPVLQAVARQFGSQLLGVIEDTENGHQRYVDLIAYVAREKVLPCRVVSVARSSLKEPEDHQVGQAIVFSAESILRKNREVMTGRTATVIGYGKIGGSIARELRQRAVHVGVLDINPSRQVLALAHGFASGPRAELLRRADLVFCATGNVSLRESDFGSIRSGAYVFSATSGDDEIEGYYDLMERALPEVRRDTLTVQFGERQVHFANDGNAVNFLHGGIVGPYIRLVQGELVYAATQLTRAPVGTITEIPDVAKRFIAIAWMKCFASDLAGWDGEVTAPVTWFDRDAVRCGLAASGS